MKRAILGLAVFMVFAACAAAQTSAQGPAAAQPKAASVNDASSMPSKAELRGLIRTLEDEAERKQLIARLNALIHALDDEEQVRLTLDDGQVLTGRKPHQINQLGVARVFQTPEIFPDLTVLQNVMAPAFAKRDGAFRINFVRSLEREKDIRTEAEAILEDVGLLDRHASHAGALSRGVHLLRVREADGTVHSRPFML